MTVWFGRRLPRASVAEEGAQATVEMAVVVPIVLVLGLIVYNLMVFMAATARFDRVAPDIVLAHGVAPVSDGSAATDGTDAITAQLEQAMGGYDVAVEVQCEWEGGKEDGSLLDLAAPLRTYRCTMHYRPWPSGLSIAGASMGAPAELEHERTVTVDPWKSGVVI